MSPRGVVPVGRGPVYPHGTADDAAAARLAITERLPVSELRRVLDRCPPWLAGKIVRDILEPLWVQSLYQPESDEAARLREASAWLSLPVVEAPDAARHDDV